VNLVNYAIPPDSAFYRFIAGDPEPAGSPKIVRIGGHPAIRWQKGHKWTALIRRELMALIPEEKRPLIPGPVRGYLLFIMPKPHKPKFQVPATPPDGDKLERATLDGFTYRGANNEGCPLLVEDDARFISLSWEEQYVTGENSLTGVHIWVWPSQ